MSRGGERRVLEDDPPTGAFSIFVASMLSYLFVPQINLQSQTRLSPCKGMSPQRPASAAPICLFRGAGTDLIFFGPQGIERTGSLD